MEITSLPICVRFLVLPLEYYTEGWLKRAGNSIGRTIKLDIATLLASRERFARVEVDLQQPLKTGYCLRGEFWRLKYEGLLNICFECGHYGHRATVRLVKEEMAKTANEAGGQAAGGAEAPSLEASAVESSSLRYGEWTSVQFGHQRQSKTVKGNLENSTKDSVGGSCGKDQGRSTHN